MSDDAPLFAEQAPLLIAPCVLCGSTRSPENHPPKECVKEQAWRAYCRQSWARVAWPADSRGGT